MHSSTRLQVGYDAHYTDHRPVTLTFAHSATCEEAASTDGHPPAATPVGWRFHDTITEEHKAHVVTELETDPRLASFHPILETAGATAAYRLLHEIIRDAWSVVGITVCQDSGSRHFTSQLYSVPVGSWFDDEVATHSKPWRSFRRRRRTHPELQANCQRARRIYEKLRATKMRRWEQRWERLWVDVAHCNQCQPHNCLEGHSGNGRADKLRVPVLRGGPTRTLQSHWSN